MFLQVHGKWFDLPKSGDAKLAAERPKVSISPSFCKYKVKLFIITLNRDASQREIAKGLKT
jgi:hypothetical protein